MAPIACFEDLIAWQKARALTQRIYRFVESGAAGRDFKLADQLRSAVVSVMSNVAEGFDRRTPRDFRRFLIVAKASCAEVQSLLYVALDAGYLPGAEFESALSEARELSRVLGGLIAAVTRYANSPHDDRRG